MAVGLLFIDLWFLYSLFALHLGVIHMLCSVTVVIPGHLDVIKSKRNSPAFFLNVPYFPTK